MLECVVTAPGPSLNYNRITNNPIIIGCSRSPRIVPCHEYVVGDSLHLNNIPNGTIVHCTKLLEKYCKILLKNNTIKELFTLPDTIRHAGNSGGLAISVACQKYNHIGLIGFDGFPYPMNDGQKSFLKHQSILLKYWLDQGKTFYSLMDKSVFDEYLVQSRNSDSGSQS